MDAHLTPSYRVDIASGKPRRPRGPGKASCAGFGPRKNYCRPLHEVAFLRLSARTSHDGGHAATGIGATRYLRACAITATHAILPRLRGVGKTLLSANSLSPRCGAEPFGQKNPLATRARAPCPGRRCHGIRPGSSGGSPSPPTAAPAPPGARRLPLTTTSPRSWRPPEKPGPSKRPQRRGDVRTLFRIQVESSSRPPQAGCAGEKFL